MTTEHTEQAAPESALDRALAALEAAKASLVNAESDERTARAGTDSQAKIAAMRARQTASKAVEAAQKAADKAEIDALEAQAAAEIAERYAATIAEVSKDLCDTLDPWLARHAEHIRAFGGTGIVGTLKWDEPLQKFIWASEPVPDGQTEKPGLRIITKAKPVRIAKDGDGGGTSRPKGGLQMDYDRAMMSLYPDNLVRAQMVALDNELIRLKTTEAIKQDHGTGAKLKDADMHMSDQRHQVLDGLCKSFTSGLDTATIDKRREVKLAKYKNYASKP